MITTRVSTFFLLTTLSGHALSIDCNIANKTSEKVICSSENLLKLDNDLNQTYSDALKNLPPTAQKKLKSEQREWIKKRDSDENVDVELLTGLYESRILAVRNFTYSEANKQPATSKEPKTKASESKNNNSIDSSFSIKINLGWLIGGAFALGLLTFLVIALTIANRKKRDTKTRKNYEDKTIKEAIKSSSHGGSMQNQEKESITLTQQLYLELEGSAKVPRDETTFDHDETKVFVFPDGVILETYLESIDEAELWLENYDEMEYKIETSVRGVSFDEPECEKILEEESHLCYFKMRFVFKNGEATLAYVQFSEGIQAGFKVELEGDLTVDELLLWTRIAQDTEDFIAQPKTTNKESSNHKENEKNITERLSFALEMAITPQEDESLHEIDCEKHWNIGGDVALTTELRKVEPEEYLELSESFEVHEDNLAGTSIKDPGVIEAMRELNCSYLHFIYELFFENGTVRFEYLQYNYGDQSAYNVTIDGEITPEEIESWAKRIETDEIRAELD